MNEIKIRFSGKQSPDVRITLPRTLVEKIMTERVIRDVMDDYEVERKIKFGISFTPSEVVRHIIIAYLKMRGFYDERK